MNKEFLGKSLEKGLSTAAIAALGLAALTGCSSVEAKQSSETQSSGTTIEVTETPQSTLAPAEPKTEATPTPTETPSTTPEVEDSPETEDSIVSITIAPQFESALARWDSLSLEEKGLACDSLMDANSKEHVADVLSNRHNKARSDEDIQIAFEEAETFLFELAKQDKDMALKFVDCIATGAENDNKVYAQTGRKVINVNETYKTRITNGSTEPFYADYGPITKRSIDHRRQGVDAVFDTFESSAMTPFGKVFIQTKYRMTDAFGVNKRYYKVAIAEIPPKLSGVNVFNESQVDIDLYDVKQDQ